MPNETRRSLGLESPPPPELGGEAEGASNHGKRRKTRHWRFLHAVQLYVDGVPPLEIAETLNCSCAEVDRWIELSRVARFHELPLQHHPGRAKLLDARGDSLLSALLDSHPASHGHQAVRWTIPLLRLELAMQGYVASNSTVWRAARRLGWLPEPKPLSGTSTLEQSDDEPSTAGRDRSCQADPKRPGRCVTHSMLTEAMEEPGI
jgi:transposase